MITQVGNHQAEIEKLFPSDGTSYSGLNPIFEVPLLLLAFTNRSGSNLLADYLRLTGNFGGLYEHLNGFAVRQMSKETKAANFPEHVASLARNNMNGHKVFGFKASWDQILMLQRWNIHKMFSSVHVLHIEREDLLAQAVSYAIADQTKRWMSTQPSSDKDPKYEYNDIKRRIEGLGNGNKYIRQICSIFALDYYNTTYEKLMDKPVQEIATIHNWLAIPVTRIELTKTRLVKQADETNQRFKERFRQDAMIELMGKASEAA